MGQNFLVRLVTRPIIICAEYFVCIGNNLGLIVHATCVFQDKYDEKFSIYLGLSASKDTTIIYSLNSNGNTHEHTLTCGNIHTLPSA